MKTCTMCKQVQYLNNFYFYKGKHRSYCKECARSAQRERHLNNPETIKKRETKVAEKVRYQKEKAESEFKAWREANPEEADAIAKAKYHKAKRQAKLQAKHQANPKNRRYAQVKYTYGLSPEEYDAMSKECAICGATERLHIDHNHATGEIRGILCGKCNTGLGMFNEDTTLLFRAADYMTGMLTERVKCMVNEMLGKRGK